MTEPTAPIITGARYEGFDLPTKYGWMQQGEGADAVTGGLHYLATVTGDLTNINAELGAQLAKLGVSWSGSASVAASGGLTELAGYAGDTHEVTRAGGDRLTDYAGSFARLRSAIPKPVDVGEQSWAGAVLDGLLGEAVGVGDIQSDYRRRMLHQRELDAQANRALYAHEQSARRILASFTVAQPPPSVLAAGAPGPRSMRAAPPAPQPPARQPPSPSGGATGTGGGPARPDEGARTWPSAGSGDAAANTDFPSVAGASPAAPRRPGGSPADIRAGTGLAASPAVPGRLGDGPGQPPSSVTEWPGRPRRHPGDGTVRLEPSPPRHRQDGSAARTLRDVGPLREAGPTREAGPMREAVPGLRDGSVPPVRNTGSPGVLPGSTGFGRDGECEHRNNHFLPSDEPFDVPLECYRDYAPPVLGRE